MSLALVVAGVILLAVASDHFVVAAARLSRALRVPLVVVGAVVIGFGTSLPEALVSGLAAARGELDVGVGNVVGSNAANLAFLLGLAGLMRPLAIGSPIIRREAPVTLAALALFAALVQEGLGPLEGVALSVALLAVVGLILHAARRGDDPLSDEVAEALDDGDPGLGTEAARVVIGLAGTLLGAHLLLVGALDLAETFGLAGGFVGLTIVAVGTSLPELTTVVQAARHDEPDLVLGNLLGSSTFNALFVGGVVALVGPAPLADADLTVVAPLFTTVLAGVVWLFLRTGMRLERWESAVLVGVYGAFIAGIA